MQCKPVTLRDLVDGQTYIQVVVTIHHEMWLEVFTMCGQPDKDPKWGWQICAKKQGKKGFYEERCFASSTGLDPEDYVNNHRVFEFNDENETILRDLVAREDLVAYLTMIGVPNPHELLAERDRIREINKHLGRETEEMERQFGERVTQIQKGLGLRGPDGTWWFE